MDMLAQFFATNYALYASASNGRRGMFYPPMACHPSHLAPFLTPQAASAFRFASRVNLPIQNLQRQETHRDTETHKDDVKFSIDNILNNKNRTEEKDKQNSKDTGDEDDCMIEEEDDDDDDESSKYSWLQCTRYKPPKLPRLKRKDGGKKRKLGRNPRVPFTQHQVAALEQKFRRTHYLSSMDVAELSAALNLTETRVKIWFQNRRARERRDRDAIQRGQVIHQKQTTSIPVPGTSWSFPNSATSAALAQYRESFSNGTSAFTPVSL